MTAIRLQNDDARVVYLATVYHLGRPGAEIAAQGDGIDGLDGGLGLRAVHDAMLPALGQPAIDLDLSAYQVGRLGEALLGVSNELRAYGMAEGRSAVPRFSESMDWLYPETTEEPGLALDIVEQTVMLRRRLESAIGEAAAEVDAAQAAEAARARADRKWWQIWRR
jgi:hypothetical protein